MRQEQRVAVTDPTTLEALAHPVRLDLLSYLMSSAPRTASECARAIGDNPSNCSYHLRVLAKHGLVRRVETDNGRERPWEATITGLVSDLAPGTSDHAQSAAAEVVLDASLQLDRQVAREFLRSRDQAGPRWQGVQPRSSYGLRVTPEEMRSLLEQIDALVRPFIAATRQDAPAGSGVAHVSVLAVPRPSFE